MNNSNRDFMWLVWVIIVGLVFIGLWFLSSNQPIVEPVKPPVVQDAISPIEKPLPDNSPWKE